MQEVVIASIMKFVLLGLQYVHKNGGIHRDVKVGVSSFAGLRVHTVLIIYAPGHSCSDATHIHAGITLAADGSTFDVIRMWVA